MKTALVLNEDYKELGRVIVSDEELNHFSNTGSAVARVVLTDADCERLGIDSEDYVFLREV